MNNGLKKVIQNLDENDYFLLPNNKIFSFKNHLPRSLVTAERFSSSCFFFITAPTPTTT